MGQTLLTDESISVPRTISNQILNDSVHSSSFSGEHRSGQRWARWVHAHSWNRCSWGHRPPHQALLSSDRRQAPLWGSTWSRVGSSSRVGGPRNKRGAGSGTAHRILHHCGGLWNDTAMPELLPWFWRHHGSSWRGFELNLFLWIWIKSLQNQFGIFICLSFHNFLKYFVFLPFKILQLLIVSFCSSWENKYKDLSK